jgi:hypothetical protein
MTASKTAQQNDAQPHFKFLGTTSSTPLTLALPDVMLAQCIWEGKVALYPYAQAQPS